MLIVQAIQVQNVDGICTYEVEAYINQRPIWRGIVKNHRRTDGFGVLMGHLARVVGLQPEEQRKAIEAAMVEEQPKGRRCPTCRRALMARTRGNL